MAALTQPELFSSGLVSLDSSSIFAVIFARHSHTFRMHNTNTAWRTTRDNAKTRMRRWTNGNRRITTGIIYYIPYMHAAYYAASDSVCACECCMCLSLHSRSMHSMTRRCSVFTQKCGLAANRFGRSSVCLRKNGRTDTETIEIQCLYRCPAFGRRRAWLMWPNF